MSNVYSLVSKLKEASSAYYNSGNVIMDNETYDALLASLRKLDPDNEYLNEVGAPVGGSNKVGREIPMGTLTKYHKDEEVKDWLSKLGRGGILICPKYDGFGLELVYKDKKLVLASTRGTGYVGEDVTEAIMSIPDIPHTIDIATDFVVRGEVIIPRSNHEKIKSMGYTAMRNAIPGIVRSNKKEALELSSFVAYEFLDGCNLDRITQRMLYYKFFNVERYNYLEADDFDDIKEIRDNYGNNKDKFKYEIDGVVLKSNMIRDFDDALLRPDYSVAWKFKSNREQTVLRGVEFQLGATGKFTPIGIFDEVEFQGAKLKKASLGSMTRFNEMDPKPMIGSIIEVSRRGDIIPYIEEVVFNPDDCQPIPLEECPHCHTKLTINNNGEPVCKNPECPEKLRLKITQYVKGLGIKGIGDGLVRALIRDGKIHCLSDIYELNPNSISDIKGQGNSSVTKWKDLQDMEITLLKFLSSYPLENIGEKVWSKVLVNIPIDLFLKDPNKYRKSLEGIKGLGESKINSLISQILEDDGDIYRLLLTVNII